MPGCAAAADAGAVRCVCKQLQVDLTRRCAHHLLMCCRHHKREADYGELVQALADYCVAHRDELPLVIWRDNSPQHFAIEHGEFPHPEEASSILGPEFKGCKPIQVSLGWLAAPCIGCGQAAATSGQLGMLSVSYSGELQRFAPLQCRIL